MVGDRRGYCDLIRVASPSESRGHTPAAMSRPAHQELLEEALTRESEARRALLAGDEAWAGHALCSVADLYRRSWENAPPRSFGRLIGMLKAAVLAGGGREAAAYARSELPTEPDSPVAWYALALAALVEGDERTAARAADGMREGGDPFARTAEAIAALAARERERYAEAIWAIVADFEARGEHLTGVPLADTALVLERLAEGRGLAVRPESPLLP
jgi:hypothetical protein